MNENPKSFSVTVTSLDNPEPRTYTYNYEWSDNAEKQAKEFYTLALKNGEIESFELTFH